MVGSVFIGGKEKAVGYHPGRGPLDPLFTAPISVCFPLSADEEEDEEEVYKMAGVMAQCGGLDCMLNRLAGIRDFKQGRHLLTVSWGSAR